MEEFYQRLQPFAVPFMALFDRDRLPALSTLSRFLAALSETPVEALRTLFLDDLLSRPLTPHKQTESLLDRAETSWIVFDIDGMREAARQRVLPQTDDLLPFVYWMTCALLATEAANAGRLFAPAQPFLRPIVPNGSAVWETGGNGRYREELRKGLSASDRYLAADQLPQKRMLLRLDGLYGTGSVLSDLAGFAFVTRGKEYSVLDHPLVQARLHLPPDQFQQRPESQAGRSLSER